MVFGFYLPFQSKNSLNRNLEGLQKELDTYSEVYTTYSDLLSQESKLEQDNLMMDNIENGSFSLTGFLKGLEEDIPENVTISSISLDAGLITIQGNTPSYENIAEFIVKLRKLEDVSNITFLNAVKNEEGQQNPAADAIKDNNTEEYQYTLYINLKTQAVPQQLLQQDSTVDMEEQESTMDTEEQGVTQDEAD
jgi:Tfp pilus assembly protein PilN